MKSMSDIMAANDAVITKETTDAWGVSPVVEVYSPDLVGGTHPGGRHVAGSSGASSGDGSNPGLRPSSSFLPGGSAHPGLLSVGFEAMTTTVNMWLESAGPEAAQALLDARHETLLFAHRFSRFQPDSELMELNRRAGLGPTKVSRQLFLLVRASLELARQSRGLVDPTVLPTLVRLGYGDGPSDGSADYTVVTLDEQAETVELPTGYALDLGGVAKGWLANALSRRLGQLGSCLIDIGGDLQAFGEASWTVEIENPFAPCETLCEFELKNRGVATSSVLKRRWGSGRHHLIDPRSGLPVESDLVSATVVAETALVAEGEAKTVLMLGLQAGTQWMVGRGLSGALVCDDWLVRRVGLS